MAQGLPGLDSVARSLPGCPPWGLGSSFSFQNPIVLPLLRDTGPHTSIAGLVPGGAHTRVAGLPSSPHLPEGPSSAPLALLLSPWLRAHQATRQDRQQCHQPAQKAGPSGASSRPCRRVI